MSAAAIRDETVIEETMNAIILYDKFDLATKAKAMLEHAMERADATTHWIIKPWRVNLLTLEGMGKAALKDAADAHLMVLALRQSASLPLWLPVWLEKWAGRRQMQEAALAVFHVGDGDRLSANAPPELSQFAERHGLSLIVGDVCSTKDAFAAFARSLHEREVVQTPTLRHIMEQPLQAYACHWGIND